MSRDRLFPWSFAVIVRKGPCISEIDTDSFNKRKKMKIKSTLNYVLEGTMLSGFTKHGSMK